MRALNNSEVKHSPLRNSVEDYRDNIYTSKSRKPMQQEIKNIKSRSKIGDILLTTGNEVIANKINTPQQSPLKFGL